MPSICAIILNYRGASRTAACVRSLVGQTLTRVLVADNSADPNEAENLRRELSALGDAGFAVDILENPANLGFARGMNAALHRLEAESPHDFYFLLNNDAEARPGMVEALAHHLEAHPETGLAAPLIQTGAGGCAGLWYHRPTGLLFSKPTPGCFHYLSGCCLMVRRELVTDGLFDEDFFMYGEDVELSWRLSRNGVGFAVVDSARLWHEGTASSRHGDFFYEHHVARGHVLLARKLATAPWQVPVFLLGRVMALAIRAIVRSFRFRTPVPLRVWVRLWLPAR